MILLGRHPRAKAPLVLGNEGAGVIEDAGDSGLEVGSRVMFTGPYGVGVSGTLARLAAGAPRTSRARAGRGLGTLRAECSTFPRRCAQLTREAD